MKNPMDMNLAELRQLKAGLTGEEPAEQRAALNDRINELTVEERVASALGKYEAKQQAKSYDDEAKRRWKGLRDKDSDFYKEVNAELERRGDSETNPLALLDAANKIGLERGDVQEGWQASADTQAIMKIKGSGNPEEGGSSDRKVTEKSSSLLDALVEDGFLNKDNEASMARINGESS